MPPRFSGGIFVWRRSSFWNLATRMKYRYAVVNDRRVIVEPRTRKIIKIID
jgi:hypothetical protein